jgi:hypothetical protein
MLKKYEAAAGLQNAMDLRQGVVEPRDRTENQRPDHGVERVIWQRKRFERRIQHLRLIPALRSGLPSELASHVSVGFGEHQARKRPRVVRKVETRACSDLEDLPG